MISGRFAGGRDHVSLAFWQSTAGHVRHVCQGKEVSISFR